MLQNKNDLTAAARPEPVTNVDTPQMLSYYPPERQAGLEARRLSPPVFPTASAPAAPAPLTGSEPDEELPPLLPKEILFNSASATPLRPLITATVLKKMRRAELQNAAANLPPLYPAGIRKGMDRNSLSDLMYPKTAVVETPEEQESRLGFALRRTGEGIRNAPPQAFAEVMNLFSMPWYLGAVVEGKITGKSEGYWYESAKGMREGVQGLREIGAPTQDPDQTNMEKLRDPGIIIPAIASFGTQLATMMVGGGLAGAGAKGLVAAAGVKMTPAMTNAVAVASGSIIGGTVEGQNTYFEGIELGMTPAEASTAFVKHAAMSGALSVPQLSFVLSKMPAPLQHRLFRTFAAGGTDAITETLDETAGAWSLDPDIGWKEAVKVTGDAFAEIGPAAFIVGIITGRMGLPPEMALKAAGASATQAQVDFGLGGGRSVLDELGDERLQGVLEKEADWFRTADGVRHSARGGGGVVRSDTGLFWMSNDYGHPDGELLPTPLADIVEVGMLGDAGEEIVTYNSERMRLLRESAKRSKDDIFGEMSEFRTVTVEDYRRQERDIRRATVRKDMAERLRSRQQEEFDRFTEQMDADMAEQKAAAANISGVEAAVKSGLPEIQPDAPVAADVPADQMDKILAQFDKIAEAEWQAKIGTANWLGLPADVRKARKKESARRLAGLQGSVTKLQNQTLPGIAPSVPGTFAAEVEAMIANYALTGQSTDIETLLAEDMEAKAMAEYEADIEAKVKVIERIGERLMGGSVESAEGQSYSLKGSVFGAEAAAPAAPAVLAPGDVAAAADAFITEAPETVPTGKLRTGTPQLVSGDWYRRLLQYSGSEGMMEAIVSGETTVEEVLMTAFRESNKLRFVKDKTGTKLIAAPWGAGTSADTYNANLLAYVAAVREAKTALAYVMENEYSESVKLRRENAPTAKEAGQPLFSAGTKTRKLSDRTEKLAGYSATMRQTSLYNDLVRVGAQLGWADNYAAAELASEVVYAQANAQFAAGAVKSVSDYYDSYLGELRAFAENMTKERYDIRRAEMGFRIPKEMVPGTMRNSTFGIPNEMLFSAGDQYFAKYTQDRKQIRTDLEEGNNLGVYPQADSATKIEELARFSDKYHLPYKTVADYAYKLNIYPELAPGDIEYGLQSIVQKQDTALSWYWNLNKLMETNYKVGEVAEIKRLREGNTGYYHADLEAAFGPRLLALQKQRHFTDWIGSTAQGRGKPLPNSVDLRFQENGHPKIWFYGTDHSQDGNFGWLDTRRYHPFFHFGSYQAASERLSNAGRQSSRHSRLVPLVTNMANAFIATDGQANAPYSLMLALMRANGRKDVAAFKRELIEAGYALDTEQKQAAAALTYLGYDGVVYKNISEGTADSETFSVAALIPNTVKSVYHSDLPYVHDTDILRSSTEAQIFGTYDPATKNIELFLGSDLHTVLHEFAHAWRQSLTAEQLKAVGKWANGKGWKSGDPWSRAAEEKFAGGFVAWAGEGRGAKVPKDLEDTFGRIGEYLSSLYREGRALRPDVKVSESLSTAMERIFTRQLLRSKDEPEREEGRRRQRLRAQFAPAKRMDLGDHIDSMAELLDMPPQSPRDKQNLVNEANSRKKNKKYLQELDMRLKEWEATGNPALDIVDFMIVRDRAIDIRVKFEGEFREAYRRGPDAVNALLTRMANDRTEMDIRFYRMVAGDAGRRLNALTNRNTNIDTAILLKSAENAFGSKSFDVLYAMLQHPAQAFELADKMAGEVSPKLWDLYMQAHYGFRLSSPDVLAINFIGTGLWTAWNYSVHRPLAGTVDSMAKALSYLPGFAKTLDRFYFRGNPRARDHFNTSVLPLYAQLTSSVPYGLRLGKEIVLDRTGGAHTLGTIKNMDITSRDVNSWQRFTLNRGGITARAIAAIAGKKNATAAQIKFENAVRAAGPFIAMSTTFMRASDMVFKVIAVEGEINRIAQEEASQMFPNNPTARAGWIKSRTQTLINDPGKLTDAQAKRMVEVAAYNTFQDMPLKFSRHLIAARESFPIIKTIIPYYNTLVNLGKRGLEMTPGVGLVAEKVYRTDKDFDPNSYGHTKADIIAKQLEGAMFIAAVMMLFDEDEMTGAAPDEPNARKIFFETGKIEYGLKVGDYWYSYANIQPFNVALSIATNLRKYVYENAELIGNDDPDVQKKVNQDLMQATWSIANFMANNDFMRNFEQLTHATTAETRNKRLGSYAEMSLVPYNGFIRWMMKTEKMMQNPDGTFVPQKANGFLESSLPLSHNIMNKLFGLPLTEQNRLSVWGEPYTYSDNKWYDSWFPVQYAKVGLDPVDQLMEELQWAPELPRQTYHMNRKEYRYDPEIWQQLALGQGAEGKPAVARLIERSSFQNLGKEEKLMAIDKVLRPIREKHQRKAKAAQRRAGLQPVGEGI